MRGAKKNSSFQGLDSLEVVGELGPTPLSVIQKCCDFLVCCIELDVGRDGRFFFLLETVVVS